MFSLTNRLGRNSINLKTKMKNQISKYQSLLTKTATSILSSILVVELRWCKSSLTRQCLLVVLEQITREKCQFSIKARITMTQNSTVKSKWRCIKTIRMWKLYCLLEELATLLATTKTIMQSTFLVVNKNAQEMPIWISETCRMISGDSVSHLETQVKFMYKISVSFQDECSCAASSSANFSSILAEFQRAEK